VVRVERNKKFERREERLNTDKFFASTAFPLTIER
jgi:hypothetical protein